MFKEPLPNAALCTCSALLLSLCAPGVIAQPKADEEVKGPVPAAFKLDSDAWFVERDTYIISTTDADFIASQTNRGYEKTPEGLKRTRTAGWKWSISKSDYSPVADGTPVQGKLNVIQQQFWIRTKDNFEQLVRQNGSLLKQKTKVTPVTRTERVPTGRQVQTGFAPFPGTLVPAPVYEDEYENRTITVNQTSIVNTPVDSVVPYNPIPLPEEINVGTTISFINKGVPDFKATWMVTHLYKHNGVVYAEGDLKSADEDLVTLSGTMVLRPDVGVVELLTAKAVYPNGEFNGKPLGGSKTYQEEFRHVSKAQYEAAQAAEWRRFADVGTNSANWAQDVAEARLVMPLWSVKGADWKVHFQADNHFAAYLDAKTVGGTWKIVNRHVQLTSEAKTEGTFAFSLANSTLEATGDSAAQPSKFFDDAAQ